MKPQHITILILMFGLAARVLAAPPANDDCAGAIPITDGVHAFSTIEATTDGPAHASCIAGGDGGATVNDIWFTYTAPVTGYLTVSTCEQLGGSADYDTDLVIYQGINCGALSLIACNDDDADNLCGRTAGGFHSRRQIAITEGQDYLIRLGGWSGTEAGTGTLYVQSTGVSYEKIALTGDALSGSTITTFGLSTNQTTAVISNSGAVAFAAVLADGRWGVYIYRNGTIHTVIETGMASPDGDGVINAFWFSYIPLVMNNSDKVAIGVQLSGTTGGTQDDDAVLVGDENGLQVYVREGDMRPSGAGTFYFSTLGTVFRNLVFNDAEQIAFSDFQTGVFRVDSGGITQVYDNDTDVMPDDAQTGTCSLSSSLNDNGELTIYGNTSVLANRREYFFDGSYTRTWSAGDAMPDGNGTIAPNSVMGSTSINNLGQTCAVHVFIGNVGTNTGQGVYRFDNPGWSLIARGGAAAPDGVGTYSNFSTISTTNDSRPHISSNGIVSFRAKLSGSGITTANDVGLYRHDGSIMRELMREGDLMFDNSTMGGLNVPCINSSGAVITYAGLNVMYSDGGDPIPVSRVGQTFDVGTRDVRTISSNALHIRSGPQDGRPRSLNDNDEIAIKILFTDDSQALYIARINEPNAPACPADLTDSGGGEPDGQINVFDLFVLLGNWNTNGTGADLAEPTNLVDVFDLFVLLGSWGDCK